MLRSGPRAALAALALTAAAISLTATTSSASPHRKASAAPAFDVEGHRGARGLRPENTLAAFGKALQIGVTTLELDTGVTEDGVVVVSHERRLSTLECQDTAPASPGDPEFPYVGKLIKDLSYAQIATLDCGTRHPADPATDPFVGTQESVPGTHMPKLADVFALADRYGAKNVQFNVETKIDPTMPGDTVDPETFAAKVVGAILAAGKGHDSLVQSFDWRTLVAVKQLRPHLRTVALADLDTIQPGVAGPSPWTAGIDVDEPPYNGDVALAARAIDADVLSPDYAFMSDAMIASAHALGMPVIPWTINEPAQMDEAVGRGVDGIISDYPNLVRDVLAARGIALPRAIPSPFDVQGHRGGRAARPENTLSAFTYGLDAGADTLELDTGVTEDGVLVVLHDRRINGVHCSDTAPVTPGDPEYPYVGDLVRDLTLAQIKTLDCGHTDPGFPAQVPQPGERIPTLQQVFDLVAARGDTRTRFNIETKISPLVDDTAPYDVFTRKLVKAIVSNHLVKRATIQSFDWRTTMLAETIRPAIDTVALVWQFAGADCDALDDECSLEAVMGDPSVKSPWTNGLDWWASEDLATLVLASGASVVSSNWQVHDPSLGHVDSSDWYLKEDPAMFHGPDVAGLHARGLEVIPYTIDDETTMQRVIELGVDGIISDDVDLLQLVAKRNGLE